MGEPGGSPIKKRPPLRLGGLYVILCAFSLRGDDPEALALRPSHAPGPSSPSLWRAPCITSLASGSVQGGLTIEAVPPRVKCLGQVIFRHVT